MKKMGKFLTLSLIIFLGGMSFVSNTANAGGICYEPAFGDFVYLGGKQVFVCPYAGSTPCLYGVPCDDE